jgi:hypothetical protein
VCVCVCVSVCQWEGGLLTAQCTKGGGPTAIAPNPAESQTHTACSNNALCIHTFRLSVTEFCQYIDLMEFRMHHAEKQTSQIMH